MLLLERYATTHVHSIFSSNARQNPKAYRTNSFGMLFAPLTRINQLVDVPPRVAVGGKENRRVGAEFLEYGGTGLSYFKFFWQQAWTFTIFSSKAWQNPKAYPTYSFGMLDHRTRGKWVGVHSIRKCVEPRWTGLLHPQINMKSFL